jgi:hypothetical protein
MSSANVARVISCDWGISEVKIRHRKGPRTLPCRTPNLMGDIWRKCFLS